MADAATEVEAGVEHEGLRWLERFEREHGRRLRVLHIGNVANNAYNNAKIQRQRGIEADVFCRNDFHIMGCPEWEDADFVGDVGDPVLPDWWAVDLRGYSRPRWFVQGAMRTGQDYLIAMRQGRRLGVAAGWRRLELERWLLCRRSAVAGAVRRLARIRRPTSVGVHVRLALARRRRIVQEALGAKPPPATAEPERPELSGRWRELFPERAPLTDADYAPYVADLPGWRRLLTLYDVVQAYSTDPIIPLLCGRPFVAYEHGTLREIPFEESALGRISAIGYREAAAVLVTNTDVVPAARRLGIPDDRLVLLPHAVDSDRLLRFGVEHAELAPRPGAEVVFFAPARQDWVDGDVSWAKGNDRALRALALVRERGYRCRLVLAEWGRDLAATQRLVDELGLSDLVSWIRPLRKQALWERYLSAHAVLDQFVVPALGGVAFEAMALGRRVVTALDSEAAEAFFGDAPPLFAASEAEQIADAMTRIVDDPLDEAGLGDAARDWFGCYHSADRIVDLQARAYRGLVDGRC